MKIDCGVCCETRPIPDVLEIYVQFLPKPAERMPFGVYAELLAATFDDFLRCVKQTGFTANVWKGSKGPTRAHLPALDVTLIAPRYRDGWGIIRVNYPKESTLCVIQAWLDSYFSDREVLRHCVKLHKLELAFDFKFVEGGSQDDYAALALRLGRSLHTRYAQNTYAIAIVGEPKRCRDHAINGKFTLYLQSAKRQDRYRGSDRLQRNTKSSKHSKLYPKKLDGEWGLRIECTPSPAALKKIFKDHKIPFDPQNISGVLRLCDMVKFADIYQFKLCDVDKFCKHLPRATHKDKLARRIKLQALRSWLEDSSSRPVAEQMRAMSCVKSKYGLHAQQKARCIKSIDFTQAGNMPLPEEFEISQRKGRHRLPEDVLADGTGMLQLVPFHGERGQDEPMAQGTPTEQADLLAKCRPVWGILWGKIYKRSSSPVFKPVLGTLLSAYAAVRIKSRGGGP